MHVFKYSPRKGTKAATFENQIDGEVKKYRQGKIPQIGWNKVAPADNYSLINCDYFYFVFIFITHFLLPPLPQAAIS